MNNSNKMRSRRAHAASRPGRIRIRLPRAFGCCLALATEISDGALPLALWSAAATSPSKTPAVNKEPRPRPATSASSTFQTSNLQLLQQTDNSRASSSAASTFRTSDGIVLTKWSLVSKSFAYLGEESRKLANARNDLKQLQTDLPQQDITRSTAAAELRKENAAIAEEIEKLLGGAVEENWSKLNGTLDGDLVEAERKRKVIAARKGELEKEYASEVLALKMEALKLEKQLAGPVTPRSEKTSFSPAPSTEQLKFGRSSFLQTTSMIHRSLKEKYVRMKARLQEDIGAVGKRCKPEEESVARELAEKNCAVDLVMLG